MDIKFQIEFFVAGESSARHIIFYRGMEMIPQVGDCVLIPKEGSGHDSFVVYERRFILAPNGNNESRVSQIRIQLAPKLP